jgi:hypothetical protein
MNFASPIVTLKPNLSFDDASERISQSFVFSDQTTRHEPLTLGRLVRSEPDKCASIWIANYRVDRN